MLAWRVRPMANSIETPRWGSRAGRLCPDRPPYDYDRRTEIVVSPHREHLAPFARGYRTATIPRRGKNAHPDELTVRGLSAITFVHPAIGEYAAALRVTEMEREDLAQWLHVAARAPEWREVVLLAAAHRAEDIVELLVEGDDPSDVTATEGCLAAAALAEESQQDPRLVGPVVKCIKSRLESPVQMVSMEAAEAAVGLASLAPELLGPIGRDLIGHEHPWSNFAGVAIAMTAGSEYITTDQAQDWLGTFIRKKEHVLALVSHPWSSFDDSVGRDLTAVALRRAAERIMDDLPADDAEATLERLLLDGSVTSAEYRAVVQAVQYHGMAPLLERVAAQRGMRGTLEYHEKWLAESTQAWRVLLEATVTAIGAARAPSDHTLGHCSSWGGAVFQAMGVHGVPVGEFVYVGRMSSTEIEPLVEVIRGTVFALGADETALADEINRFLDVLDDGCEGPRFWDAMSVCRQSRLGKNR